MSTFEFGALRSAIGRSFEDRGVQPLPVRFPRPVEHWRLPYAQLAREVELSENLDDGYAAAARFLDPVLENIENRAFTWKPERLEWVASK